MTPADLTAAEEECARLRDEVRDIELMARGVDVLPAVRTMLLDAHGERLAALHSAEHRRDKIRAALPRYRCTFCEDAGEVFATRRTGKRPTRVPCPSCAPGELLAAVGLEVVR